MSNSTNTLPERTLNFSNNILLLSHSIKQTTITKPIISQLVRSATSIGANYSEVNNAASKQDFRNKIFIAKKETAETKYWLELVEIFTDDKDLLLSLQNECQHLLMIFQKIINTLKNGSPTR